MKERSENGVLRESVRNSEVCACKERRHLRLLPGI